jgi:glycosyltransferase involved in cell wall biosynthesis
MVDFIFAGPIGVNIPSEIKGMSNVCFLGPVDRQMAALLYLESDVFIFPTLSDGFGLTQLEALGHGLPVIASTRCGHVVEDCVTGFLLSEVTPEEISEKIIHLVRHPQLLATLRLNAKIPDRFHPNHLAPALSALAIH